MAIMIGVNLTDVSTTTAVAAGTIGSPVDHQALLQLIVETAALVCSAEAGSLFLIDEDDGDLFFEVAILYFVVTTLLNVRLASKKTAWVSLLMMIAGTLRCSTMPLMDGMLSSRMTMTGRSARTSGIAKGSTSYVLKPWKLTFT